MTDEGRDVSTLEGHIWDVLTKFEARLDLMARALADRIVALVALVLSFAAIVVAIVLRPSPWFAIPVALFALVASPLWWKKGR